MSIGRRYLVPLALGVGMLALVLAAALTPYVSGGVTAQVTCPQYGSCSTTSSTGVPSWEWGLLGVLVAAALVSAGLLLRRRRRPGPNAEWEVPEGPRGGPALAGAAGPAVAAVPSEPGPSIPSAAASTEDPVVPLGAMAAGGAAAVAAAPPVEPVPPPEVDAHIEGTEADIDSLMAELDKISGEMHQTKTLRGAKSASLPSAPSNEETR